MKVRITLIFLLLSMTLQAQRVHGYRPETWAYLQRSCDSLKRSPLPTAFKYTWRSQPQALVVKVNVPAENHAAAAKSLEAHFPLEAFAKAFPSASLDTLRAAVIDLRHRGMTELNLLVRHHGIGAPISLDLPKGFPDQTHAAGHIDFDYHPEYHMLSVWYYLTGLESAPFADRYQSWLAEIDAAVGGLRTAYLPDAKPGHPTFDLGDLGKLKHAEKMALLQTHRSQIVRSSCMDGGPRSHLNQIGILAAEVHDFPLWLFVQLQLLAGNLGSDVTVEEDIESAKEIASMLQELGLPITRWLLTMSLQTDSWGDARPHIHPSWFLEMHNGVSPKELRPLLDKMLGLVADEELDGDNRANFYHACKGYILKYLSAPGLQGQEMARLNAAAATLRLNH